MYVLFCSVEAIGIISKVLEVFMITFVTLLDSFLPSGLPSSHWNKGEHLEYLFGLVTSLILPDFPPLGSEEPQTWSEVKTDIWMYVDNLTREKVDGARLKLCSRLVKKKFYSFFVNYLNALKLRKIIVFFFIRPK